MNTGTPAVSGDGAMGVIEPVSAPYKLPPIPLNWPAYRVPTPDEWDRIEEARRISEARITERSIYD